MDHNLVDLRIWGKSRGLAADGHPPATYPLICHLLDAAAFAGQAWDHYLSDRLRRYLAEQLGLTEPECRSFVMLLAGLHDIGKACPGFQNREDAGLSAPDEYPRDGTETSHTVTGQLWLGAALRAKFGWPADLAFSVAEIVGGHHGIFKYFEERDYHPEKVKLKGLGGPGWGPQRGAIVTTMRQLTGAERLPAECPVEAQVIACAVVVLADWLASRTEYIRTRMPDPGLEKADLAWLSRFLSDSEAAARNELNAAGLVRLELRDGEFIEEFGFEPNRLQASLESKLPAAVTGPGLLIVTEQMGKGKTQAALFAARVLGAASGTAGLAFLLPTMATSNAMETRLVEYVEARAASSASVNLVHSMAWLRRLDEETEPQDTDLWDGGRLLTTVTEWLGGGRKAAFAPVCVGTIDQALLGVLPLKYNAFRLLAFANKTIIIDEVHAFDAYVRRLLSGFLSWCGHLGIPVVLMSATLPRPIARKLTSAYLGSSTAAEVEVPYPGWAFFRRGGTEPVVEPVMVAEDEQQPLRIELAECAQTEGALDRITALRRELEPLCVNSGCAAVVCTTVKEAQQTYMEVTAWLAEAGLDAEVVLLHSNMPLWQREQITDRIVDQFGKGGDRSGRTIVISTQVIEQSVDIDMDLMISDLAPLELLLQRAGRGHRHPENNPARPAWAEQARLVVLVPEGGADPIMPKRWEYVYPPASLIRTQRLLLRETGGVVTIPRDVQRLVDELYTDDALIAGHEDAERESRAREFVQRGQADRFVVPKPGQFSMVAEFSGQDQLLEETVSTRFDADSLRTLPLFERDGDLFLDPQMQRPLPRPRRESGRVRWDRHDVAEIVKHTVPVRRRLLEGAPGELSIEPLDDWQDHSQLKYLVPLTHQVGEGSPTIRTFEQTMRLDPVLGLVLGETSW